MFKIIIAANSIEELNLKISQLAKMSNHEGLTTAPSLSLNVNPIFTEQDEDDGGEGEVAPHVAAPAAPITPFDIPSIPPAAHGTTLHSDPPAQIAPLAISNSTDVDAEGIPWDSRIHSANKQKKGDGTWRIRRNVDEKLLETLTQNLKNKGAGVPNGLQPSPVAPLHIVPVETGPAPVAVPPSQPAVFDTIAVPKHDSKPVHSFETFKENFTSVLTDLINQKKIDRAYIVEMNKYFGVKEIWELMDDSAKLKQMYESFVTFGWITAV